MNIGEIYNSNNFGKIKIIREMRCAYGTPHAVVDRFFEIEFLNTGFHTYASTSAINAGRVKDYSVPVVANGVGYVGSLPYGSRINDKEYFPYYKAWNDMMHRCYNPEDKDYSMYGALGIKVEERWHNFSVFFEDIKYLPNYDKKIKYPDIYQLDKDYLQRKIPKNQRIYSRNTCMWLSKPDNIFMSAIDRNPYGYCGVTYKDNGYCAKYNGTIYGKFSIIEAAANLINYIHLALWDNIHITVLNDVKTISFDDLEKYAIGRRNYKKQYFKLVQRLS